MKNQTTYRYAVATQNVDLTLRATISSLGNYILNTAGIDAQNKGFGVDALSAQNFTWVLSRLVIEIDSRPEQFSEFDLTTWVNKNGRLISTRNFTLSDMSGNVFCRTLSQWCMLDYSTRMPVDMSVMAKAHEGHMVDAPSPCERPRRLGSVESEPIVEHKVVYSDIDFNRHMNTLRYIDIIFDSMPIERVESMSALRMDINFMREARYGDSLSLMASESEASYAYEYRNAEGDALCRFSLELK